MKTMATQLSLLLNSRQDRGNLRLLVKFILVLLLLFLLYTVLFHVLMLYEGREYSWITGFYWTLTTMSTLGFGDITFHSDLGRVFSVLVLLSGIVFLLVMLPFTFIQFFYAPWLDKQNKARAPKALSPDVSGHVIITYFDDVAINLIQKLASYSIPYVVVVPELQTTLDLHDMGYNAVVGELDDPETYRRLRIDKAAMALVLNDDVTSTNIIYTIREVNDRVITVTNADTVDSVDILELAGSTHVFEFSRMLGDALSRRVLGVSMRANVIGSFDRLLIAEVPVMRTWFQGKTLAEAGLRQTTGVNVVGLWDKNRFMIPTAQSRLQSSTVLVLAGTEDQLKSFDQSIGYDEDSGGNHAPVVVLGGGRVGQAVARALEEREVDFRVVEKRSAIAERGSCFICGNAADRETLAQAGINETPSIIITTHKDDLNIYLTIYCRRLRPDAQIISRASLDRNVNTMHRAGANLVLSYSSLVTTTIMNLLHPQQMLMLSEGLNIFRVIAPHKFEDKPLERLRIREQTGCSVVAVKKSSELIINPEPDILLNHGDELVLIGSGESEKKFTEKFPAEV
ncbi:MAG: potassium channel family protein [Desulfonatronovibrionaceae bacterium]